jgi:hypothetical protein
VSPVKYKLGFYIPEDDILHSDRREILKSYKFTFPLHISPLYASTNATGSYNKIFQLLQTFSVEQSYEQEMTE